jgi:NADH-quinone oxidoreductase subunit M
MTLLPLYFLVGLWGLGASGRAAATRYFLIMLAGGVPLLLALVLLAEGGGGFDLPALLARGPETVPHARQLLVFLLLLLGFGVKVPFVPLHTWLPSLALGGPAAVTALLVGLKLGAYGLLRFALPLAPSAARELHWLLAGLGTVAILYGAVAALAQSNLRAVLAYGSVAHVGLAVLGLSAFSVAGTQGAVLLLLSFALTAGGGFLLLDALQRRVGSCDLVALSGVRRSMPRLAGFFLLFGLAAIGLPGTAGFPAEFLIVVAVLQTHSGAALAALFGMVVGAAAFLAPYRAAFFGPLRPGPVAQAADLTRRESVVALLFALLIVLVGVWPGVVLELLRPAAEIWAARLS